MSPVTLIDSRWLTENWELPIGDRWLVVKWLSGEFPIGIDWLLMKWLTEDLPIGAHWLVGKSLAGELPITTRWLLGGGYNGYAYLDYEFPIEFTDWLKFYSIRILLRKGCTRPAGSTCFVDFPNFSGNSRGIFPNVVDETWGMYNVLFLQT